MHHTAFRKARKLRKGDNRIVDGLRRHVAWAERCITLRFGRQGNYDQLGRYLVRWYPRDKKNKKRFVNAEIKYPDVICYALLLRTKCLQIRVNEADEKKHPS